MLLILLVDVSEELNNLSSGAVEIVLVAGKIIKTIIPC